MKNINKIFRNRFTNKSCKQRYSDSIYPKFPFYSLDKIIFHNVFIIKDQITKESYIKNFYVELYNELGNYIKDLYYP
jgi:hypothetical protein